MLGPRGRGGRGREGESTQICVTEFASGALLASGSVSIALLLLDLLGNAFGGFLGTALGSLRGPLAAPGIGQYITLQNKDCSSDG